MAEGGVNIGELASRVLKNCRDQLECALKPVERKAVNFLSGKGFITDEVRDDVLNPRSMLTEHQKAGQLVDGIVRKVNLDPQSYQSFLDFLRESGKYHEGIVRILDSENCKLGGKIVTCMYIAS